MFTNPCNDYDDGNRRRSKVMMVMMMMMKMCTNFEWAVDNCVAERKIMDLYLNVREGEILVVMLKWTTSIEYDGER